MTIFIWVVSIFFFLLCLYAVGLAWAVNQAVGDLVDHNQDRKPAVKKRKSISR